jgi:hypothetical protein
LKQILQLLAFDDLKKDGSIPCVFVGTSIFITPGKDAWKKLEINISTFFGNNKSRRIKV